MMTFAIKKIFLVAIMALTVLGAIGCTTAQQRNAGRGAVVGAGAGAIVGAATTGTGRGAVVGALAGAGTGAVIGAVASRPGYCNYRRPDGSIYAAECPRGY